jgi:hypothetical protein
MEGRMIRLYHGASCDLPVFRSNELKQWGGNPRYRFDTYGAVPKNYRKWHAKELGLGGAFGYTNSLAVLIEAIDDLNRDGITAPICDTLFDECLALGATVLRSRSFTLPLKKKRKAAR